MGIKVRGDLHLKIKGWKRRLSKLEGGMDIIATQMADETIELVREGFDAQENPYGEAWAPLQMRQGDILADTGRLKSSWFRKFVSSKGFTVASAAGYAHFHQGGTGIHGPKGQPIRPKTAKALAFKGPGGTMFRRSVAGTKARKMLPDNGLPNKWRDRMNETAIDTMKELFRA